MLTSFPAQGQSLGTRLCAYIVWCTDQFSLPPPGSSASFGDLWKQEKQSETHLIRQTWPDLSRGTYALLVGHYGWIILLPLEELVASDPLQVSAIREQHSPS